MIRRVTAPVPGPTSRIRLGPAERRPTNRASAAARNRPLGKIAPVATPEAMPLRVLLPAFLISELRRAFEIGFLLFLPFLVIDLIALAFEFERAACCARLGRCGHENLHLGFGTDDRSDIAAVENRAFGAARESALHFDQGFADFRHGGND